MLEHFSKKIKNIYTFCIHFFKQYLPEVVFLVFMYQLLAFSGQLPYLNIITKYYFYVFGFLWILSNFLFKQYITNRRILVVSIAVLILAIPTVVLEIDRLKDILGFIAFVFLLTYVVRQILREKEDLKKTFK